MNLSQTRIETDDVMVRKRCHPGVARSFLGERPGSPEVNAAMEEIAAWIASLNR